MLTNIFRAVARALIRGCIFIYSGSARLVSFEIKLISKEASRAEPEYMNIHPPPPSISVLATALNILAPKLLRPLKTYNFSGGGGKNNDIPDRNVVHIDLTNQQSPAETVRYKLYYTI